MPMAKPTLAQTLSLATSIIIIFFVSIALILASQTKPNLYKFAIAEKISVC